MQVIKQSDQENFNNEGTGMILLSDELWLIANNFQSFANWSKLLQLDSNPEPLSS